MKKLLYLSLLIFSVFLSAGCELLQSDEFEVTDPIVLPEPVVNFIQDNFPDFQIRHQDDEDLCDNTMVLKIELEDGPGPDIDLYFSLAGDYLFSSTDILADELPQAVRNTIDSAYANYVIDAGSIERFDFPDGTVQYEVELIDINGEDYDLLLAQDGTIICWEEDYPDDDDDNNGSDTLTTLPDSVRAFISSQYEGYRIDGAEREDLCDDQYFFKVELEDGPGPDIDLYFSLNWEFQFAATDISLSDLPVAVSDSLAADFPGYQVVEDEVERLDFPNGGVQYLLEIESTNSRDRDVIYNADGALFCDDRNGNDDDNDDDDDDANTSLPDSIRAYVNSQYAGYQIDGVEREDLCGDQYFFKVELEDGPGPDIDLYFSLSWEFRFTATEISTSALPAAVTNALAADYPGARIDDDDTERLDFPDGSVQYYFEVETSDDDYDLIYTSAGVLVCSERS